MLVIWILENRISGIYFFLHILNRFANRNLKPFFISTNYKIMLNATIEIIQYKATN